MFTEVHRGYRVKIRRHYGEHIIFFKVCWCKSVIVIFIQNQQIFDGAFYYYYPTWHEAIIFRYICSMCWCVYQSMKWFAFNMFCLYFQLSRYFSLSTEMWITLMHLLGFSQTWNNIIFNGWQKMPCSFSLLLFLTSSRQFSQNP